MNSQVLRRLLSSLRRSGGRRGGLSNRMILRLVVAAIAGIAAWFSNSKRGASSGDTAATTPVKVTSGYQVYLSCDLVSSKYNDGDSFLVNHDGTQQEYRLYYVDTPESRDKPYADHRQRVEDQGRDLGGLSYKQALEVGKKAKEFTTKVLNQGKFEVYTKKELVYQGPRQYAFVRVDYQGKKQWLHELLVSKGLARVHTKGVETPLGQPYRQHKSYLLSLRP